MIRALHFRNGETKPRTIDLKDVPKALKNADDLVWVDLASPSLEETTAVLQELFHFHPLAIEDCLNAGRNTPKIDEYGGYVFIISHAVDRERAFPYLFTREIDLFLGQNFLVTSYPRPKMPPIQIIMERLERDERLLQNGSDFLCHAILDAIVDEFAPLLEDVEDEVEALEQRTLRRPSPQSLERLVTLKHGLLAMNRIVLPLTDVVNRLSRDPFPMIDLQSRIYFRDVYDHLRRTEDSLNLIRDMVNSAQEMYVNASSLRMNEVMKALTIVSTIFLPLSFVAGVYGMNFDHMPELRWPFGYPMTWMIFIGIAATMLVYFKRKGWW